MSREIVKELHTLIDDIAKLVDSYRKEQDSSKKIDIIMEIARKQSRLQLLIAELVTL